MSLYLWLGKGCWYASRKLQGCLACRATPAHAAVVIMLFLGSLSVGARTSFGIAAAAWLLRSAFLLAQQPEDNEGHRAGGRGFSSEHPMFPLVHISGGHYPMLQAIPPDFLPLEM